MNSRTPSTISLVTGVLALAFGIWGFVDRGNSGYNEAAIEQTMMWIALSIIVLAVSAIATRWLTGGTGNHPSR